MISRTGPETERLTILRAATRPSWETMTSVSAGHIILTPTQPVDFSTAVSTCVLETCGDRLAILRRDPVLVIKLGGHHYGNMNNHVPDVSTRNLYPGGSDLSHLSILKFFYVTCQTLCLRAGSWRRSTTEDPFLKHLTSQLKDTQHFHQTSFVLFILFSL